MNPDPNQRMPDDQPNHQIGSLHLSALGFAQVCSWGTLYYAFPQLAVEMMQEFDWSKPDVYGALTLGLLLSALGALPAGFAIDKGYGRTVMAGGSVMAGLLLCLWAEIDSLAWFYVAVAGIGFLHSAVLYEPAFAVVAKLSSPAKTRQHITVITLWGGFASTVFIPVIEYLLNYFDWRHVLLILAGINIFICAGIYHSLPRPIQAAAVKKTDMNAENNNTRGVRWALKQPVFWTLLGCFIVYWSMESAFRFHLYPLLIGNGLSGESAVFIIALLGPSQVAGRFLMSMLGHRTIASIGIFALSTFPVVFLAMIYIPKDLSSVAAMTIAYGAAAGVTTIVKANAIPDLLTRSSYGSIYGVINTPVILFAALAPSIAALSWDRTGSYSWMLVALLVASVLAWLLFLFAVLYSKRDGN